MIGCRATAFPAAPPPWRNWQRNVLVMRRLWVRVPQAAPPAPAHRIVGGPEYFRAMRRCRGCSALLTRRSQKLYCTTKCQQAVQRTEKTHLWLATGEADVGSYRGTTSATISHRHRRVAAPSAGSVAFGRASCWYSSSTTSMAIRPPTGGKIYASSARTVIHSCRPSKAAIAAGAGICDASVTRAASRIDRVARSPVRSG